ncbi:MAG: radical SAM protein [Kiritimatiellae bacterium]|nr:radical SAM protein [Kiritimatiellia bacterium]
MNRSTVGTDAIIRLFWRVIRHPRIAAKLVRLQADKRFFHILNPKASEGYAGKIRQLSLRITDVCNLRCMACGQWGKEGFLRKASIIDLKRNEVSPQRYIEVFADLARQGHYPLVYFWGGEPMLYPGTVDLIEECTGLGMPASIATNGTGIVEAAGRLQAAPLFLLQVSVDGPTAEIHNRIRPSAGTTDNFTEVQRALEAVGQERKHGLPLIASLTTLCRENSSHLADTYEMLHGKVDVCVFYLSWWIDEEAALRHEIDFSKRFGYKPGLHRGWIGTWKPDDYSEINRQFNKISAMSQRKGMPPVIVIPSVFGEDNLRRYYNDHSERFGFDECISIFQAAEINSNGDVSPCRDYHDYVVGNIKQAMLADLWGNDAYRKFRCSLRKDGLMPVCSRCCGLMGY